MDYISFVDRKPMVYAKYLEDCENTKSEVLAYSRLEDIEFCIMNIRHTHPAFYVKVPNDIEWDYILTGHQDISYKSEQNPWSRLSGDICEDGMIWVGWDYGHCDDYYPPSKMLVRSERGTKYTTEDVYEDVQKVIKQVTAHLKSCNRA